MAAGLLFAFLFAAASFCVAAPPVASGPVSPTGTISNDWPLFVWTNVPTASWYQLWINRDGQLYHQEWLRGDTSWSPSWPEPLQAGSYRWWVRTWSPDGYGNWSGEATFTLTLPAAVAPTTLSEYVDWHDFNFHWMGDPYATWARIYLERNGEQYIDHWRSLFGYDEASDENGYAGWYGDKDHHSYNWGDLPAGQYKWYVQEWRSDKGSTGWSTGKVFTVKSCTNVPANIAGINISSTNSPRPDIYWWNASGSAPWYYVWINKDNATYLTEWMDYSSWWTESDLPPGNYNVWVMPWNECGNGNWSSNKAFTINYSKPGVVTNLENYVDGSKKQPCFGYGYGGPDITHAHVGWDAMHRTYWYEFWLQSGQSVIRDQWFDIDMYWDATGVNVDGGRVYVGGIGGLPAGSYQYAVRAWNGAGIGDWSSTASITVPALTKPTLIAPSVTNAPVRPLFRWSTTVAAEEYQLWINRANGTMYHEEKLEVPCNQSGSLTNSWQPHWNLTPGTYNWWIQPLRANGADEGPWSDSMMFTVP